MRPLPLILCYHKIERRGEFGVTRLSPRRFARQVDRIAAQGYRSIGLTELALVAEGRRVPGPREVLFTFDDAYRGLREHAFPILAAHGFSAVCSVVTEYAGRLNRWDVAYGGRRFGHLAWRDIARWSAQGIEFVSHTATHPRLTWLADGDVAAELARSKRELEHRLGRAVATIVYPFGAAGLRERTMARAEGYTLGLDLAGRWRGDPLAVPRLPVYPWSLPVPGHGPLAAVEHGAAYVTNRCALGTTLWLTARQHRESAMTPVLAPAE